MNKPLSLVLFGIAAISLTGCYTQVAVQENDDIYVYHEPIPVIIYYPAPEPILVPVPLPHPLKKPEQPIYKIRKPIKLKYPVTHIKENDRIRDEIRNSGGRNDGGRKSRR